MKYHPDYELEMTKDEERYFEYLKKFDALKESADRIARFIEYTPQFFTPDLKKSFCNCCWLTNGCPQLNVDIGGISFSHDASLSTVSNLSNFFSWATSLPFAPSTTETSEGVSWRIHFDAALEVLFTNYADFLLF